MTVGPTTINALERMHAHAVAASKAGSKDEVLRELDHARTSLMAAPDLAEIDAFFGYGPVDRLRDRIRTLRDAYVYPANKEPSPARWHSFLDRLTLERDVLATWRYGREGGDLGGRHQLIDGDTQFDRHVRRVTGGPASLGPVAEAIHGAMVHADDVLRSRFGRDSWDGKGGPFIVNRHLNQRPPTFDAETGIVYADSPGPVPHEFVHGIQQADTGAFGQYEPDGSWYREPTSAGNEAGAELLGRVLQGRSWTELESVDPAWSWGRMGNRIDGEPLTLGTNPNAEAHAVAGVYLNAARRSAELLRGQDGRRAIENVWYEATTRPDGLGLPRATMSIARRLDPADSGLASAIDRGWHSIGLQ